MRVQAFPAQLAVERLDERIVSQLPRPREIERHAMRIGPEIQVARDAFTALVNAYALWIADGPANPLERTHHIFRAVAEPRINHRRELRKDTLVVQFMLTIPLPLCTPPRTSHRAWWADCHAHL